MVETSHRDVNFGPLTTTWTASDPSCYATIVDFGLNGGSLGELCQYTGLNTQCSTVSAHSTISVDCSTQFGYFRGQQSVCVPGGPRLDGAVDGVFSPGFACPSGYTSACRSTSGGYGNWPPFWPLSEGETAVGCCPSSYTCSNDNEGSVMIGQNCYQTISETSFTALLCDGSASSSTEVLLPGPFTSVFVDGTETSTEVISKETLILTAELWQLVFKADDLLATSTSTSTSSIPSNTPTTMPESSQRDLSTGGKAGIGVGAVVAGLLALGALLRLLRRYRKRHRIPEEENTQPNEPVLPQNHTPAVSELGSPTRSHFGSHPPSQYGSPTQSHFGSATISQYGSPSISQLGDEGQKFEMPGSGETPNGLGIVSEERAGNHGLVRDAKTPYHELA
ncbi:hypothetical protein GGR57DRAFT_486361 [Xylariaceae sp. FL1272]|nr:hypothetical protein GGR57DRAFT_486361 [Xylariaceae sp. FL1272]